jgi:hypothetical protein
MQCFTALGEKTNCNEIVSENDNLIDIFAGDVIRKLKKIPKS